MKRSDEMVLVGYFLARCGEKECGSTKPPRVLGAESWDNAYACFYPSLGAGRTLVTFRNSLKNARDLFDGHLDSGRVGWREPGSDRAPAPLTSTADQVYASWQPKSEEALWEAVRVFYDPTYRS